MNKDEAYIDLIKKDLMNGEDVLWTDMPKNIFLKPEDVGMILYSLLFGIFILTFYLVGAFGKGFNFMWFFMFPFVFCAIYMLFGKFICKSYINKRTYYYVTNSRIIILRNLKKRKIYTGYIDGFEVVNTLVQTNGIGKVIFGNKESMQIMREETGMEYLFNFGELPYQGIGFYNINDAYKVSKIVNKIKNDNDQLEEIN